MHQAAEKGLFHLVKALIAAGEPVDQHDPRVDSGLWTALTYAAYWGHGEIVRILLAAGANPNHLDVHGWTPLQRNVHNGRPMAPEGGECRTWLSCGQLRHIDSCIRVEFSADTFHQLVQAGAWIESADYVNGSPLIYAVDSGYSECVEYLVAHGANVNRVHRTWNISVLAYAVIRGSERIMRCLIAAGADLNCGVRDESEGETALERALRLDVRKVMWVLVSAGARLRDPVFFVNSATRYLDRVRDAAGYQNLVAIYRRVLTAPLSALSRHVELSFGRAAPPEIVALILEFWKPPGGP
jgi:ankyrin repeat protein